MFKTQDAKKIDLKALFGMPKANADDQKDSAAKTHKSLKSQNT